MATVTHFDPQQCPPGLSPAYAGKHKHPECECDSDAAKLDVPFAEQPWNTRAHIKQDLDGHWPLRADQDVVICERCRGAIRKTTRHKAALSFEGLPKR